MERMVIPQKVNLHAFCQRLLNGTNLCLKERTKRRSTTSIESSVIKNWFPSWMLYPSGAHVPFSLTAFHTDERIDVPLTGLQI